MGVGRICFGMLVTVFSHNLVSFFRTMALNCNNDYLLSSVVKRSSIYLPHWNRGLPQWTRPWRDSVVVRTRGVPRAMSRRKMSCTCCTAWVCTPALISTNSWMRGNTSVACWDDHRIPKPVRPLPTSADYNKRMSKRPRRMCFCLSS